MRSKVFVILLSFFLVGALLASFAFSAPISYSSANEIPASCTGGALTQDEASGACRTITCSEGANSLQVQACDKPDSGAKEYFEMYKKISSGTVPKICLATTCIQGNGYAKSPNFPIIIETTPSNTTTPPPSNNTNSTNPPPTNNTGTCASKVNDLQVACTGGTITTDNKGSCRTVICTSSGSSMQAMACDKPTSSSPAFYEVYNQGKTGTAVSNICFGSACVNGAGYAKASFPFCSSSNSTIQPPLGNQTNATNNTTTPTTNATTCSTKLNDLPATCTGTITSDVKSGCRVIACSATNGNVQVQACEKTDLTGKYFEMYRQSGSGTAPQVCIGSDCLKSGWGYEQGSYFPICHSNIPVPPINSSSNSSNGSTNQQLNETSMNFMINGKYVTLSTAMNEDERTFEIPVRDWSLAGVFYESAGFNSYETGAKEEVFREEGTGGKVVSDTFCDGSMMNVELLGSLDVGSANPAKVHILRTQPGYKDLDVILNFVPTGSSTVSGAVSPAIDWDGLGEAFIHQFIRDRNDFYLQHYFIEGENTSVYNKTVFLQKVNESLAEGKAKITLSSERIKHPTDATAKNKYTFTFENPSSGELSTMVIESAYMTEYGFSDYDLWTGSRYDIYLLRKAGIPVNEFSVVDSHWRSAECAQIMPK